MSDNVLNVNISLPIPPGRRVSRAQVDRLIDGIGHTLRGLGDSGDTYLAGDIEASNGRVTVEGRTPRTHRVIRRTTRKLKP